MNCFLLCRYLSNPTIFNSCLRPVSSRTYSNSIAPGFVPPASKLPPKLRTPAKQNYDFFLVLDFEATCDSPVTVVPQEIIEFPILKLSAKTFEVESVFHSYVKPTINPELTKFCSQLTGITQELIHGQPLFEDVYEKFQQWMQEEDLLRKDVRFVPATCGDWDLKFVFPSQCKGYRIPVPKYMSKWINIKVAFAELSGLYPRNMSSMLKHCGLEHLGRLHSGLDDCKNIANLLRDLAYRGVVLAPNAGTF